jgi:hypothetical protein
MLISSRVNCAFSPIYALGPIRDESRPFGVDSWRWCSIHRKPLSEIGFFLNPYTSSATEIVMGLTIGGRVLAEIKIQGVTLRALAKAGLIGRRTAQKVRPHCR